MSVIVPSQSRRERKVFRRRVLPAVLGFLVVVWIVGTITGPPKHDATGAKTVTAATSIAPATIVTPATTTTVYRYDPYANCQQLVAPAGVKYERHSIGLEPYFDVLTPDGHGNFLDFGTAMFDGGPIFNDSDCAEHQLLIGPTADKLSYLRICEVKPFPSGQHIRYSEAGDGVDHITVIVDDNSNNDIPYGYVVHGETTVYPASECADVAASI